MQLNVQKSRENVPFSGFYNDLKNFWKNFHKNLPKNLHKNLPNIIQKALFPQKNEEFWQKIYDKWKNFEAHGRWAL